MSFHPVSVLNKSSITSNTARPKFRIKSYLSLTVTSDFFRAEQKVWSFRIWLWYQWFSCTVSLQE